ncbi:MAG: orotidine 5'-phosphate decarboxylase [Candidatus Hodarchaeales archaeon]|jgi:orotidine-5'-phosphate decarboxylase
MSKFSELINKNQSEKGSRIIWAFDPPLNLKNPIKKGKEILDSVESYISAVKLNRQLILPLGLHSTELLSFIDIVHSYNLPVIMDAKVNDIGYTNYAIATNYYSAGFDALIVNPFIGWNEGVDQIFKAAEEMSKQIILLAFMSHKDGYFGYGREVIDNNIKKPFYQIFVESANSWGASGVISGATHIEKIKEIRELLDKDKLVISPGIGAQGGSYEAARKAGMDFGIVGRGITLSENPVETVKIFIDLEKKISLN